MPKLPAQQSEKVKELYESVRTPKNLAKFEDLLAKNVPLKTICEEHFDLPYRNREEVKRRIPELAKAIETQRLHTKHPKYRLILGLEHTNYTGVIALTADNPEELWQSVYIKNHFGFYRLDPSDYEADYLNALRHKGVHYLSNLLAIAHCRISNTGRVQIVRPKFPNGSE